MINRRTLAAVVATTTAALATAVAAISSAGASAAPLAASPLPAHVFAPYFEAWTGDNPATLAQQSGAKHLTMAFLQTAQVGSCTAFWNGDPGMPIASSTFGSEINAIRANGGDVIPSFGGFTATNTGTEIADSCTNVNSIAAVFQSVITTYDVTRIDLDIEDNSLTKPAGIDRRNKAIKMTEDWAASQGRTIQFSYTLPTTTHGLAQSGLAVLRNAVTNNARIDVVNIMTFDYYDNQPHNMATDTQTAAQGLHDQLAQLYPSKSDAQLWSMIGVTEMIGIDDFGPAETFHLADAPVVLNWARSKGIAMISFWALQRDNGSCPGGSANDSCSGIAQETWEFSHIFAPFTSGTTTQPPTTPPTTAPPTTTPPSSPPGGSCANVPAWDSGTVYTGGKRVSHNGRLYEARWWTLGETPGTAEVWRDLGSCTGSPPPTTAPPTTAPPTTAPPTTAPPTTPPGVSPWAPNTAYSIGQLVSFNGVTYSCRQAHTSLPGWEPPNVPALWQPV